MFRVQIRLPNIKLTAVAAGWFTAATVLWEEPVRILVLVMNELLRQYYKHTREFLRRNSIHAFQSSVLNYTTLRFPERLLGIKN